MLRPIPSRLLRDLVTVKVCTEINAWQNPEWDEYIVSNVHLQNSNEIRKTKDNTEVVLRAILFIDSVRSSPALDYGTLMEQSEAAGKPMRCIVQDANGNISGDFEVILVDLVPDVPATRIHHVELGLV